MLNLNLTDEDGVPLDERIRQVMPGLEMSFRHEFPSMRDDAVIANLFEEAARRIAAHERKAGTVEALPAFARATLFNLARSKFRRSESRVNGRAVNGTHHLEELESRSGSVSEVEALLTASEVLRRELNENERRVFVRRIAGFKSKEIASEFGLTVSNVDQIICRARAKLRSVREKWMGKGDA